MRLIYVSIVQLSNYKVFIGHSKFNTMIQSSWLVFTFRANISILNLFHTIKMLKLSYILIRHVINKGFPLWLINFDLTKEDIVKYNAHRCGEFYLTRRWIRGLISNYYVITKAFRDYLIKKEFVDSNKVRDIYDKWVLTRFSWPRAIFVSHIKSSYIVSKEAASIAVPSIALVDSDEKTFPYKIPIGSNDDSLETIGFMQNIITQYIIQCKYKKVLIWYFFNRNIKRYQSLLEWLKVFIKLKTQYIYKRNLKKIIIPNFMNYPADVKRGANFYFGRSYNFRLLKKNIINDSNMNFDNFDKFYDLSKLNLYYRFKVLNYRNLLYKYRIRFRRYKNNNKIESIGTFKSFLNNFIKLKGFTNRFRRIKIRKRIKIERKKVSKNFKNFFHFVFFFFLNKFNIMIDSYNRNKHSLYHLIKIAKKYKSRRNKHMKKYKFTYIFRYKSKKIYKKKKKKSYGYIYENFNNMSIYKNDMSFLAFHWKYLIIFLGLKLQKKSHFFNFNKNHMLRKKKWK